MFFSAGAHRRGAIWPSCKQDRFPIAIEQANDRIGRLGLIGQYAAQQLAISIVPTLGAMAQANDRSLREGGYCGR